MSGNREVTPEEYEEYRALQKSEVRLSAALQGMLSASAGEGNVWDAMDAAREALAQKVLP